MSQKNRFSFSELVPDENQSLFVLSKFLLIKVNSAKEYFASEKVWCAEF